MFYLAIYRIVEFVSIEISYLCIYCIYQLYECYCTIAWILVLELSNETKISAIFSIYNHEVFTFDILPTLYDARKIKHYLYRDNIIHIVNKP